MNRDDLGARVRDAIDRHFIVTPYAGQPSRGQDPVTNDSRLADLLIDDLDRLEVVMTLEDTFDVELDYDAAAEMQTVAELAEHVAERAGLPVAA